MKKNDRAQGGRGNPWQYAVLALALLLLWDASGLDWWVMHALGTSQGFALRNNFWLEAVLHRGAQRALSVAFVLCWMWAASPRWRRAAPWLIGIVAVGALVLGAVQTLRGAHYPSHTFWTAWLSYSASSVWFALARRLGLTT